MKNRNTLILLMFFGITLTACTTPEQRAAHQAAIDAHDHQECVNVGFKPKTAQYGDCRLRFKEMRSQERAAYNSRVGWGVGVGRFGRGANWGVGRGW